MSLVLKLFFTSLLMLLLGASPKAWAFSLDSVIGTASSTMSPTTPKSALTGCDRLQSAGNIPYKSTRISRRFWIYIYQDAYPVHIASQSSLNCTYEHFMTYWIKIYSYMSTGYVAETASHTDDGSGIHGFLETIAAQQRQDRTLHEEMQANETQHKQRIAIEGAMAEKIVNTLPDPRDCLDHIARESTKPGGNAQIGSRVAKNRYETRLMAESTRRTDSEHLTQMYVEHEASGYCSPVDVANPATGEVRNAFNCTEKGPMPDGDVRIQSIFKPATDFTDPDKAAEPSLTFNLGKNPHDPAMGDQRKAAADVISTVAAKLQPGILHPNAEKTPQGRIYLARLKTYQARVSVSINALTEIAGMRTAGAGALSTEAAKALWKGDTTLQLGNETNEDVYKRLFGDNVQIPEVPSEAELMRFEVMRRYVDRNDQGWQAQLESLAAQSQGTTPGTPAPNGAPAPTGGSTDYLSSPVPGLPITSYYGMRIHPIKKVPKMHQGVDYGGASGTPIYAVGDGVAVVEDHGDKGYGKLVRVRHANNHSTVYAHLSSQNVTNGQTVTKGQVIGRLGNTGGSTGPPLHFEFRVAGMPVEPLSMLGNTPPPSANNGSGETGETAGDADPTISPEYNAQTEMSDYVNLEIVRSLSQTNYLLYHYHRQLEIQNSIRAAKLLQKLNPILRSDMDRASTRAYSVANTANRAATN